MNTPASFTSASLYVGDLHPDVSEAFLYDLFREAGPVLSIRVCRDAATRKSLGYAYVNFQNPADAERALDILNYSVVKGKPMRIMWSHRDPAVRKSGIGNIFIKNLDKSIDNKILYDTFSTFGNILSCKVATMKSNIGTPEEKVVSKGYGFVHYETQEAAEQAIAKVNGMMLCDKIVYVGPFVRRSERIKSGHAQSFSNVYVKNLAENVDVEKLTSLFAPFGPITKAVVMTNDSGVSKGFGFVNFKNVEDAKKAVEELHGTTVEGKQLYVARAQKKEERQAILKAKYEQAREERLNKYKGLNLYVRNLDESVTDEMLKEEFSKFGTILSAKVMKTDKDVSKGFGFVCFSTPEEATKALELSNQLVWGKPLYVAPAQRREERRALLEAQYTHRANMHRFQPGMHGPVMYGPGGPMFYGQQPGLNQQRQPMFYPQGPMVARPRWVQPQGGAQPRNAYPQANFMRQQRGNRRPQNANAQAGNKGQPQGQQAQGQNQQGRRANYAYNNNARNRPAQANFAGPMPGMIPQGAPGLIPQEPLNATVLAQASPAQRKQMLGERLYPLIYAQEPEAVGKITGMLLDAMDFGELLHLIESPESLSAKVQEAMQVLQQAQTQAAEENNEQ